jgi:putative membrane protein
MLRRLWGSITMSVVANVLVALVALLHAYFLVLEMFLWTRPQGLKAFGNTPEAAQQTAVLAANQGLYNGFLAAGLVWGLVHPVAALGFQVKVFFLLCVIVAGLYGGYSAKPKIILIQALPALLALVAVWLA